MSEPTVVPARLRAWVAEVRALVRPAAVHWCDGSQAEADELCRRLVASGTFVPVAKRPGSFLARSHPGDVARVEDRTFICSTSRDDAGPTNNWRDPAEMKRQLSELSAGCMAGRTMYVIPYRMGPLGSPYGRDAVQITDSPYVVVSMRTMTRIGDAVLARMGDDFVPCLHSVGAPLAPGQADVPWPCNPEQRFIAHFPDEPSIWSYGSGYGGNALLGKKCLALRIASAMARRDTAADKRGGWLAEHMLVLGLTPPGGATVYVAAAFPSACGKTNLAMLEPALPGWTVRCVGDDIAWLHVASDGSLRAINPEAGFFGVAPGTSWSSNPHAMETIQRDTIFTNVAATADGDVWWEGMGSDPPAGLTDWTGRAWSPAAGRPAAHPNARYTVAAARCPIIDPRWEDPEGVPIAAILFGGRRARVMPLVVEANSWEHGVFLGSTIASETTAAAQGATGRLRRDPFAMLPFCGYHMADHFAQWLEIGRRLDPAKRPRMYAVNWFRKGADGTFLWPGFGDNVRVLKWICHRLAGGDGARATAIGIEPRPEALDLSGMSLPPHRIEDLLAVDVPGWRIEAEHIAEDYRDLGRVPAALWRERDALAERLGLTSAHGRR
ncbi:MAG: phosphoenolpyruvate carboxykinase (GTP) [Planctomycetes bacterium]|nr:phosphoenolpyruvate carboxykinase (GTP) [Planctomycetota bacterium]